MAEFTVKELRGRYEPTPWTRIKRRWHAWHTPISVLVAVAASLGNTSGNAFAQGAGQICNWGGSWKGSGDYPSSLTLTLTQTVQRGSDGRLTSIAVAPAPSDINNPDAPTGSVVGARLDGTWSISGRGGTVEYVMDSGCNQFSGSRYDCYKGSIPAGHPAPACSSGSFAPLKISYQRTSGPPTVLADAPRGGTTGAGGTTTTGATGDAGPLAPPASAPTCPQPLDSPAYLPTAFVLVAPADGGDPILLPTPLPPGLQDVHLVLVDLTPEVVTGVRTKLAADLQRNRALLQDYRTAYRDAQQRLVNLNRLQTLLLNSLNSVGNVGIDARTAYRVVYGADAPTPRTLPGDRSMLLDPLRVDPDQPTCGAVSPNEGPAMTFSDLERTDNDIKSTQNDIDLWPKLIKQLEDQIAAADKVLSDVDAWLAANGGGSLSAPATDAPPPSVLAP